jgi:hypothetical protein
MPGITLEFGLTIRHAPVSLQDIANEDPLLWEAFQNALQRRLGCQNPISPEIVSTLKDHFHGFQVSSAVLCRAKLYGVPTVAWSKRSDGTLEAYAEGYAEGASHVETTLTQTVQELIILAQVRRYQQSHMLRRSGEPHSESLTPDTLLGHALARLALGVQFLNESLEEEAGIRLVLFAGRRSSSRRYLLLQNLYCQLNLKGFSGTSSIPVPLLLGKLAQEAPSSDNDVLRSYRPPSLVGTLAHEVPMALTQLLAEFDDVQVGDSRLTVQICALLAHLLMLRANGGLEGATALADTYGTPGFVSTALLAKLPPSFRDDMSLYYPEEWNSDVLKHLHGKEAVVFDLFQVWRVDGGEYSNVASYIMDAWDRRQLDLSHIYARRNNPGKEGNDEQSRERHARHAPPQPPKLMHSNLDGYEDIVRAAKLPPRIRPSIMCFGSLADGFLPFDGVDALGDDGDHIPLSNSVSMSSIVMKVVQATRNGSVPQNQLRQPIMPCAGKLGDRGTATFDREERAPKKTSKESKLQMDRRLCSSLQGQAIARMESLESCHQSISKQCSPDLTSHQMSTALANAYDAVTRGRILCS